MPSKKTSTKTKKKAPAKKVTKKPAAKRASSKKTPKKTIKRKTKKNPVVAEGYTAFWVNNGPVLEHLQDLMNALADMDETTFRHHAEGEQNDFTVWVNDVLCDEECAKALSKVKTPRTAHATVKKFVAFYNF